jgi:hypothetical protein
MYVYVYDIIYLLFQYITCRVWDQKGIFAETYSDLLRLGLTDKRIPAMQTEQKWMLSSSPLADKPQAVNDAVENQNHYSEYDLHLMG